MKKIVALVLSLALLMGCAALAEGNTKTFIGTVNVNGTFQLRCVVPEGYALQEMDSPTDSGLLALWIGSEDQTRPIMSLYIAYDELLAEVERLNDLDDDALRQIEETFTIQDPVNINYVETAHGTKLMEVRQVLDDTTSFVDFYTIYKGYEIEFMMVSGLESTEPLTDEQVQMAVDFLSALDFVDVE